MTCIEPGCDQIAGTPWADVWCMAHDEARRARITAQLESMAEGANDDTTADEPTGYALFRQVGDALFGRKPCPCQCHLGMGARKPCSHCNARHEAKLNVGQRAHDSYRLRRRGR